MDNSWYSRSASHKDQHLKLIIDNHNLSYMTTLASPYILTNDGKKGDEYNMFKLQFHRLENSNDRNKMKNVIQWLIYKNSNKGYVKYFDIYYLTTTNELFILL